MKEGEISTASWDTPFNSGELSIVGLQWGCTDWYIEYAEQERYDFQNPHHPHKAELVIKVFHRPSEKIYEVQFGSVGAFRMLDEHGLLDLWNERRNSENCFMVKGLGWAKESPLSYELFSQDGWSYLIATDWECIEIISEEKPSISVFESLNPVKIEE